MSVNLNEALKNTSSDESFDVKVKKSIELLQHQKECQFSRKMLRTPTQQRLSGGADTENPPAEEESAAKENNEPEKEETEQTTAPQEPNSDTAKSRLKRPLPSTGDPRVDEMLDCALENLEEAGKALASLNENLEHDLKLFLIELMGRTRKWTSQVESKIEWTRQDVLDLHKELAIQLAALRDSQRESVMLQEKLSNNEALRSAAQTETMGLLPCQQKSAQALNKMDGTCGGMSQSPSRVQSRMGNCEESNCQTDSQGGELERLQMCVAEMEAEMLEMRKENQRIVKERADYENAIQRALLKGVSSLNVEALKVLRCTPIPNCGPPCQTSSAEPVAKSSRDCSGNNNGRGRNGGRNTPSSNESSDTMNGNSGRRVCPSTAGRSDRKSKKSRDTNMMLLLQQKDAENFGIQPTSNRCDNASKKSTACPGNNCAKYRKSNYTC